MPPASPSEAAAPGTLFVRGTGQIAMPQRCVVCDSEGVVVTRQTQDRMPLLMPGVALLRWTDVSLPYCEAHARNLARRTKLLGVFQFAAYLGLICSLGALLLGLLDIVPAVILTSVIVLAFIATLVLKPFYLYDVRITHKRDGVRFSSRYVTFLRRLADANAAAGVESFGTSQPQSGPLGGAGDGKVVN